MKVIPSLTSTVIILTQIPFMMAAHALTSADQSLVITFNEKSGCSTGKISGTYKTKLGVSGVLYQFDCNSEGDVNSYFFIDTQGSEKCYGKMLNTWGGRNGEVTSWYVQGAVPGFRCNSIGKTIQKERMR